MADLVVNDEDYADLQELYTKLGTYFEDIISKYISEIDGICSDGVTGGNVHDNLMAFKGVAEKLEGQIETTLNIAKEICSDYISDIDDADSELL